MLDITDEVVDITDEVLDISLIGDGDRVVGVLAPPSLQDGRDEETPFSAKRKDGSLGACTMDYLQTES